MDDKEQVNALSTKDLRNLFKLRQGTPSDTHDKLRCERCKIIVDEADAEAAKVLPKKLAACRELLQELMKLEDSAKFLQPLKPEEEGVSQEQYQKLVKQPMDFGTVLSKLDKKNNSTGYSSPAEFSKDVNRVFSNVLKVWEPGQELADAAGRLQLWWVKQWTELVPKLMSMKTDSGQEKENSDPQCSGEYDENNRLASYLNERGEDYQEQIGMPDEENMRNWSHHYSTDTVDDPIFRAAMRGYDAVSFVFGLEVTWSLIQQRQQEEEERQAMLELEKIQEIDEAFELESANEENEGEADEGYSGKTTEESSINVSGKEDEDSIVEPEETGDAEADENGDNQPAYGNSGSTHSEMGELLPNDAKQNESTSAPADDNMWSCQACTYLNKKCKKTCVMCNAKKNKSKKQKTK